MEAFDRIQANRAQRAELDAELPTLVWEAMSDGHTWQELAALLKVGKARIYQLRAEGKPS